MRRKSERTANKKGKASPEKKVEKPKRTRTRRRKQSSTSENESAEEPSPVSEVETVPEADKKPPQTPAKEDSPEESQDQVWHVKTSEASGDVGEIKKLKICLTRPPSTPERVDRSPRSKRKHSRATSSSDTPSTEGSEEKKKSKHRSKRVTRDLKDELDSHGEEAEQDSEVQQKDSSNNEVTQSEPDINKEQSEAPMSTTSEEVKSSETVTADTAEASRSDEGNAPISENNTSDADTTVVSPRGEDRPASPMQVATTVQATSPVKTTESNDEVQPTEQSNRSPKQSDENEPDPSVDSENSKRQERSESVDKSEILEIHADESKNELSDNDANQSKEVPQEDGTTPQEEQATQEKDKVSNEEVINKEPSNSHSESNKVINKTNVVESSENISNERVASAVTVDSGNKTPPHGKTEDKKAELHRMDSVQSNQSTSEEPIANGQAPIMRKRRWGSRTSKASTQKSITISTDVLKDIIPDVKLVEFEEVIEDKRQKREVTEKVERPVLPKIVIDNTENIEQKKANDTNDKETTKPKDLAANRKISIIKDNESIIARPPSPPKNKQSCILHITNLVRPFTLPQLKNLLQRTGRIVDDGFWIDRIKSNCFVQYKTEDQAVETRHALHGVTWPVSNPKTLHVDFSTQEAFDRAKLSEETDSAPVSTIPGTVEDWLREQDMKRERGELQEKPWERKASMREWDMGKNEKDKEKDKLRRDDRPIDKRRHRSPDKSPEPARKFKKKEEEAPAKLLDDLFRKTKTTPCIYWLPLSAETIAIKEEQRRQHMAEHERRLQELRRHRRH